jgi:Glyoxalase-like domain
VPGMAIARFPGIVIDCPEPAALELGATRHEYQPGTTFRVFLDPAGHPFCLCLG